MKAAQLFHRWDDLQIKKNLPYIVSIISLLVTLVFSIITAYTAFQQNSLSSALYELEAASKRADMSILINTHLNQNWTFVTGLVGGGAYFTVNGTLTNEGSRDAMIESIELSVTYNFSDGTPYTITVGYQDPAKSCDWINDSFHPSESRPFSLMVYIYQSMALNSHTGQIIGIGDSRSDKFSVCVIYSDGKGELRSQSEFSAKD
jgi:hypothetical protein